MNGEAGDRGGYLFLESIPMTSSPEGSMVFGAAIAAAAALGIVHTVYGRLRPRYLRAEEPGKFWKTMGVCALGLFAGLVLIGIGLTQHYHQPLQRLWPLRTFWPP